MTEANQNFSKVARLVDQYGSVAEAIKHKDDFADREWDILVTDENGDAKSKDLAYGHYVIAQTGGEAEYEIVNETADFIVDTEASQQSSIMLPTFRRLTILK